MSVAAVPIPSVSAEQLEVTWGDTVDPTAGNAEYAVVANGTTPSSGDWRSATFGTWDPSASQVTITTGVVGSPSSGATVDVDISGATVWDLWVRVVGSSERPARLAATLVVTP